MSDAQDFQSCQVGDVGVALIVAVVDAAGNPINIAAATALTIKLEKPDGTPVDKVAALYTDGSDGKMIYSTVGGATPDLDQAGEWSIQGKYTLAGAAKSTAVATFNVNDNIDSN